MTVRLPLLEAGKHLARLDEIKAKHGAPPWSEALVMTDDMQAFLICQAPGHPCDTHYHEHDEWWLILGGEIHWHIEDDPTPVVAKAGDVVFAPKLRWHHIVNAGNEPTIRLAIGVRGEYHRYDRPGCKPLEQTAPATKVIAPTITASAR